MNQNKTDKIVLYTIALLVMAMAAYLLKKEWSKSKIVYVDIGKMLEGYKFKKDLEAEGTKNLYKIKNTVDSLKMVNKLDNNPIIDSQILYAERAFDQYYTYSNQEMTKKIWERLNPLLEQYGKEKKIELLIGANGAGTLLYGDTQRDKTTEVIQYINQHYEKGN